MRRTTHLFFDLGGTLVDLRGLAPAMEREILAEFPISGAKARGVARAWFQGTSAATSKAQGASFRTGIVLTGEELVNALAKVGVHTSFETAVESVRRACQAFLPQAKLYEDASLRVLRSLRSMVEALAVVTDSDEYLVRPLMSHLGIGEVFDVVVVSEMHRSYKPDPRIYQAALRDTSARAATSLFVSDSVTDLDGAASVGMGTVWIRRNRRVVSEPPPGTVVLNGLPELLGVLGAGGIS